MSAFEVRDLAIRIAADAMFDSNAAEAGTAMEDMLLLAKAAVDALGPAMGHEFGPPWFSADFGTQVRECSCGATAVLDDNAEQIGWASKSMCDHPGLRWLESQGQIAPEQS